MPRGDTVTVRAGGVLHVHDAHKQAQRSSESGPRQPCKPYWHVQVINAAFSRAAPYNVDTCDSHQTECKTDKRFAFKRVEKSAKTVVG